MIRERIREVKSIVSKPGEAHSAATHYLVEMRSVRTWKKEDCTGTARLVLKREARPRRN